MTDELLNDLRRASQWFSIPIDGSLVHLLAKDVVRLRVIINSLPSEINQSKTKVETEIALLTREISTIRNKIDESERQPICSYTLDNEPLTNELAAVEKEYQRAEVILQAQRERFNDLKALLFMCADSSAEPQTARIIRQTMTPSVQDSLDICLPGQPWKHAGEPWIQITKTQMRRLEENMAHRVYHKTDGDYLCRDDGGEIKGARFAVKLHDGRNYFLPNFIPGHIKKLCSL
jgi:hypothetical protein